MGAAKLKEVNLAKAKAEFEEFWRSDNYLIYQFDPTESELNLMRIAAIVAWCAAKSIPFRTRDWE